ncbi:hypothetical protein QBC37DRAFT_250933, partial [Rhypophila decipiens]
IADFDKLYGSAAIKYSGDAYDSLATKFNVFQNNCDRLGIPDNPFVRAAHLPSMLTGKALDYYHNRL